MRAALSALGARGSVGLAVCTVGRPAPLAVVGGGLGASSLGASQARAFAGIISRGGGVPRGTGLLPLAAAASRSPTGVAAVDSGVPSGHGAAATHFALHTLARLSGSFIRASSVYPRFNHHPLCLLTQSLTVIPFLQYFPFKGVIIVVVRVKEEKVATLSAGSAGLARTPPRRFSTTCLG